MKDHLLIQQLSQSKYKKCECCDNVRDIYFTLMVYDNQKFLIGTIDLCKKCGESWGDILNMPDRIETTTREIIFKKES